MNLGLFFRIVGSRYRLILAVFAVTLATAVLVSLTMNKVYSSSAVLFVDVKALDPVLGGAVHTPQTVRGVLATQVELVESDKVVHGVVRDLKLDKDPGLVAAWQRSEQGEGDIVTWIAKLMRKSLAVKPSNEGSTLTITYEDTDPKGAARVANALADHYVAVTLSLRADPARQNAKYFESQVGVYRQRVHEAQARMSAFQQESGIVATDARLDIENQRLQELSSQLVAVQALATESRSRRSAVARGADSMPEVVQNELVQRLKADLGQAEAKLQELASRLGPNHPQFLSVQAEVRVLRSRLDAEVGRVASSIVASAAVNAQREAEIRAALEAQRNKVLRLRKDYDELAALSRQVDDAQKALDLVSQRLTQTHLESQAPQSNVSLLSPALPPADPARPKLVLNALVGAFVGLVLGLLAALSLEGFKRPVRTAEDLLRAVELPVLAVLPAAGARRPQRLIGITGPQVVTSTNLRLGN